MVDDFGNVEEGELYEKNIFEVYQEIKSPRTLKLQHDDLQQFGVFLIDKGLQIDEVPGATADEVARRLLQAPSAWQFVTRELITQFLEDQVKSGHSIATIKRRLSSIKTYTQLAAQAGQLPVETVKSIVAINRSILDRIEKANRDSSSVRRKGRKKAQPFHLTDEQANQLKQQADSPIGRRDRLIMCLLLNEGLRVGELARLRVQNADPDMGVIHVIREYTNQHEEIALSSESLNALKEYLQVRPSGSGPLIVGSHGNALNGTMGERAINLRVATVGVSAAITQLAPSDCRRYWLSKQTATT